MLLHFAKTDESIKQTIDQSQGIFRQLGETFLNTHSLVVLSISLLTAFVLGRAAAFVLRRATLAIGRQADKTQDLTQVSKLRRVETLIVLSIAIIRTLFIALAVYFWWLYIHPNQQPTALIGAGAVLAIVLGGVLGPLLRDFANGSMMMAEHWFGVGDHVRLEPFGDMQGIVERVTLRSTRIRGINGEVIWVNNQNISAVRVTPKGLRTIAIELFVKDRAMGLELVEESNRRLPSGALMVASPLTAMTTVEAGKSLWHITAIGETAPGREWLLEKYAITVMQEINEELDKSVLAHEPIARYADSEAELRFARAIHNSRKQRIRRTLLPRRQDKRSDNRAKTRQS
jgi:hypothetical protein